MTEIIDMAQSFTQTYQDTLQGAAQTVTESPSVVVLRKAREKLLATIQELEQKKEALLELVDGAITLQEQKDHLLARVGDLGKGLNKPQKVAPRPKTRKDAPVLEALPV